MTPSAIRETDLYAPVKRLLEKQGYEVKSEIGAVDVVARRGDEDPVIVELKTGFALSLFHQAIDRQAITDAVYIAVLHGRGRRFLKSLKTNLALCRRLGLGLMTVKISGKLKRTKVELHVDPAPYRPRKSKPRKELLLKEFSKRVGDPNTGGAMRHSLVTAYRQDALRCVQLLHTSGPTKASRVAEQTGVEMARRLMADNHYGWFERVDRGIYALTPRGVTAVEEYAGTLKTLQE